jgi:hypothetical protein
MSLRLTVMLTCCVPFAFSAVAEEVKPIKVLMVIGGGYHDYAKQKDILKKGIEERANATVEIVYTSEYIDKKITKPKFPIYGNPDYAKGYDVVIHDECASDINDLKTIDDVLKPHRVDGIPAVNLHCAMHCYRFGDYGKPLPDGAPNAHWYEYLGLHSTRHDIQAPIEITYKDKEHPITKGLEDWKTVNEEHYNNVKVYPTAHVLAEGKQNVKGKDYVAVNVWTNEYGDKKTRIFSTTIGHQNETVADARYLDLVTRGMLWACDKLNDKYLKPKK